jgi:hypothetical protein
MTEVLIPPRPAYEVARGSKIIEQRKFPDLGETLQGGSQRRVQLRILRNGLRVVDVLQA